MRRLLLIVLMVMLPLQWSWAAAASICAHEADAKAAHFGHHPHEHEAAASEDIQQADAGGLAVHADCGACHGVGTAVVASLDRLPLWWSAAATFEPYDAAFADRTVDALFRPPLTLVA
jgi:hypothetical protein